jgi:tetratricopeptide (TPR) repeat protein
MDGQGWKDKGEAYYRSGAYAEAIDAFVQAGVAYQETGDQVSAAEMLNNQGAAHRMLRQWDEAETAFLKARDAFARLGNPDRQAQATANLGMLASLQGRTKKATAYLKEAIAAFQSQGDRLRESDSWRALSKVFFKERRWLDALATYSSALNCLPHPSLGQRLLRWLFGLPLRLLGGE